ncbi:hypothetical protein [Corynebacterium sp.]|uniref:hypothetical protein n=1 Tax=Corynebacterium sp. TaxID=1720 RepID=UPI0026DC2E2E|nr:hypothetical protein [Corynebacterium sp.]MDO5033099.1 hypothetical protein [Corynebacterium sp.]
MDFVDHPAYDYAHGEDALDYLYDFFEEDLEQRVRAGWESIPEGMRDILGDHTIEDYVWLWVMEPGKNGFRQYLRDGGFTEAEIREAFAAARAEWGMNTPPHVAWLKDEGFEPPVFG